MYSLRGKVWVYPGMDGWHFVSVSKKVSLEIRNYFGGRGRGFGSIPVTVTVGSTSWKTSIFPDKKTATYLLPLKKEVRKKEGIEEGKMLLYQLVVRM